MLQYRGKDVFDTVVVGSVLNAAAVGNYRYGYRLGTLPGTVIIQVGSYVLGVPGLLPDGE